MAPEGMVFEPYWSEIGYRIYAFWFKSERGYEFWRPGLEKGTRKFHFFFQGLDAHAGGGN